jgi:hypothetical protein
LFAKLHQYRIDAVVQVHVRLLTLQKNRSLLWYYDLRCDWTTESSVTAQ